MWMPISRPALAEAEQAEPREAVVTAAMVVMALMATIHAVAKEEEAEAEVTELLVEAVTAAMADFQAAVQAAAALVEVMGVQPHGAELQVWAETLV